MPHFKKNLFVTAALAVSLAACANSGENPTDATLPSASPAASSASSPSPQSVAAANGGSQSSLNAAVADLLKANSPSGVNITGMSSIEKNPQGVLWRWALGPETQVSFQLPAAQSLEVDFSFLNPISDQDVTIEANGTPVDKIVGINQNQTVQKRAEFAGVQGKNTIILKYKSWNKNPVVIAPKDDRPMAVVFTRFAIEPK